MESDPAPNPPPLPIYYLSPVENAIWFSVDLVFLLFQITFMFFFIVNSIKLIRQGVDVYSKYSLILLIIGIVFRTLSIYIEDLLSLIYSLALKDKND